MPNFKGKNPHGENKMGVVTPTVITLTHFKDALMERTNIEIERNRRIKLLLWAFAYEVKNKPLVTDDVFDKEASLVDLLVSTGNKKMDKWFRDNFDPCTGQWILSLPEGDLKKISNIYEKYFGVNNENKNN